MKLLNTFVAATALVAAALSPLAASAMVGADGMTVATQPATTLQQDAKLKPFWEQKGDFCILIIAICIEPDNKGS